VAADLPFLSVHAFQAQILIMITSIPAFRPLVKRITTKACLVAVLFLAPVIIHAQDTAYIRVHFLYGSRPLKDFKETEPRWFGGILGGHVGIEATDNRILNFIPHGRFRLVARNKTRHSRYVVDSFHRFYSRLGAQHPDSTKKAIVIIPVTLQQKQKFDSIASVYLERTPYDYAFIGMRCGAATYEILASLGILKQFSRAKTITKIAYPKKLRKRLLKKAAKNGWTVIRQEGTSRRKWESD
jgi:hypothetical protein